MTLTDVNDLLKNNSIELNEGEGFFFAFGNEEKASVVIDGEYEHLVSIIVNIMRKHREVVPLLNEACTIEMKEYIKNLKSKNKEE